jgi:membrane protein EpsK
VDAVLLPAEHGFQMVEFTSDTSVRSMSRNALFIALRFGIYTVSGIVLVPFLLRSYGSGAYGLIALAGFLTQYVGLISGCVGWSVSRFINIALNRNDWQQANEIFSTAVVANVGFILIQIPLFFLGVWYLDWLIDFPPELASDFRILVVCNILLFFCDIMKGVFFTPIQAANRLDIGERFSIFSRIGRLILLFSLVKGLGARLWVVGMVDLMLSLAVFACGISVVRKLVSRGLVFRKEYITRKWISPILKMAVWSLVSALGFALFVKTDVWIINRFVSTEMAGVYAALLIWPNFIKQVGNQLTALTGPVYMIDYAKDDAQRMGRICLFTNKVLGLFAAVAVGGVFVFAAELLHFWLGPEFARHALLLKLMSVGLVLTLGESTVWGVFPAMDKVHYTGMANLAAGVLNVGLSIALVLKGYGVYGVAIGTLISSVLKSTIILPCAASKELGFSYRKFVFNNLLAVGVFLSFIGLNKVLLILFDQNPVLRFSILTVTGISLLPALFLFVFSRDERRAIKEFAGR